MTGWIHVNVTLETAVVAVVALVSGGNGVTRMLKLHAARIEAFKFHASQVLGGDDVAGVAVVKLDAQGAFLGFVFAAVAAEASHPVHMADIVGVGPPVGFHFGEEIYGINLFVIVNYEFFYE